MIYMKDTTIMVFGDSITYGANDSKLGGWVNRLRMILETKESHFSVFNLEISGEVTKETLQRFEFECKKRYDKDDNTTIIFAIGINDTQELNRAQRVSLNDFQDNINKLIADAKKFTNNIFFIGLTKVDESKVAPIPWKNNVSFSNKKIIMFDSLLEDICQDNQVMYIEMFDLLKLDELSDGLHPNEIGHQKICDKVLNQITKQ